MKLFLLMLKNLWRNPLRTALTSLAVIVLVLIITLIWTVLYRMDKMMEQKAGEQKGLVTEKWQFPSLMPWRYAADLQYETESLPDNVRPLDYMTWQFYGGTLDPKNRTPENNLFMFALEPKKLPMMDDMEGLDPQAIKKLEENPRGLLIGRERLRTIAKKLGDRITVTSFNYKGIDLEFDIVGYLPDGRYTQSAAMNRDYLLRALDDYERKNGKPHPMKEKTLNLFWFKVRNQKSFAEVAGVLEAPGKTKFSSPAIKCETAASGIATFIEPYRDLIWGMRWLLSPAILITMALVVANAISISVRERRPEMAVLKVLGYRPGQILVLVLGEVVFLGAVSGLFSGALTFAFFNGVLGGVNFRIAFFPVFLVPTGAFWWGLAIGTGTALVGGIVPAWSARSVRVSEVFAKVA